ncbi:MAG: C4-type zinc ribbon domain-containing protein [Deltaproteobacteria bacterium]|nr:C4-type zinc ribbon domain-containing protein [Deltaproteobacteria bacterium]
MKEVIRTLIALQKLDNEINRWRRLAAEGPKKLLEARQRLTELETELDGLKSQLADNGRRRRELEADSSDLNSRKNINQNRQLKAKNNEEYRAVLKEAESIAVLVASKEDEQLALMAEAEKIEAKLPALEAEKKTEAKSFESVRLAIEKDLAESQAFEERAQVDRTKLTESLPREVLGRYLIVAKNRDGQALAPVSGGGLCQGCRLSVPPQLFNELQKNDKLLSCPNCARIIYWLDHPDLRPQTETPTDPSLEAHG